MRPRTGSALAQRNELGAALFFSDARTEASERGLLGSGRDVSVDATDLVGDAREVPFAPGDGFFGGDVPAPHSKQINRDRRMIVSTQFKPGVYW